MPLLVFAVVSVGACVPAIVATYERSPEVAMVLVGAGSVLLAWSLWTLVTEADGQQSRFRGAAAETDTSRALRSLRRRGWKLIDDLEFDGFNVDHILVGPGGVFAIETKWTSHTWRVDQGVLETPFGSPSRQARNGARKVHLMVKHHARVGCEVHPVVVVWGPGRPDLRGRASRLRDGAVVLDGWGCASYFRQLPAVLGSHEIDAVAESLSEFVDGRERYKAATA